MNIIAFVGAGLIGAVLSSVIKQYKPEFSIYISLVTGMLILGGAVTALKPAFAAFSELTQITQSTDSYTSVLVKSLAICYLTQLASDSCCDAGEKSIASKIDFAGKSAVVLTALPLFTGLVDKVALLIS